MQMSSRTLVATSLLILFSTTAAVAADTDAKPTQDKKNYTVCIECELNGRNVYVSGTEKTESQAHESAKHCCEAIGGEPGAKLPSCADTGGSIVISCTSPPPVPVYQQCVPVHPKVFRGQRVRCWPRRGLLRRGCRPLIIRRGCCR